MRDNSFLTAAYQKIFLWEAEPSGNVGGGVLKCPFTIIRVQILWRFPVHENWTPKKISRYTTIRRKPHLYWKLKCETMKACHLRAEYKCKYVGSKCESGRSCLTWELLTSRKCENIAKGAEDVSPVSSLRIQLHCNVRKCYVNFCSNFAIW